MKPPVKLPLEKIRMEPYASVLCYPHSKPSEVESRLKELEDLGVTEIEFKGDGSAVNVPVLGKGFVGIVVTAYIGAEMYALKMRRLDGGREDFYHEAEMLKKANTAGVGPKFRAVTKNFLVSQLIDGGLLADWLEKHKEKAEFRRVLGDILEQCWRLDTVGVDHGELSKAPRHLLMTDQGQPFIVDFETASTQRNASNVTAVCQYLFAGNSVVPRLVWEVLGEKDRNQIIDALRVYKKERSRSRFDALLQLCL